MDTSPLPARPVPPTDPFAAEAPTAADTRSSLPRVLGPWDAIAVVAGSIIGSGIFLKVDTIAGLLGSFVPIVGIWILGGVASLCGVLALAELSAMLPQAGGPYVYLRQAFGRMPAFLWGWTEFSIVRTGSVGSLACGTVIYFHRFLESLAAQGLLPDRLAAHIPLSHIEQALLTVACVVLLTAINVVGTRWAAGTQNATTVIKILFLCFLAIGPFAFGKASTDNLFPLLPEKIGLDFFRALGLALVAVFWPYDGWINIGPVAEEIREPQRNVPLGLGVGMLIVVTLYVGAIFGYHLVLPIEQIQHTQAVAADVTGALVGGWGVALASLGVTISTFGALNANLLAGPRIYFAMARDGLFPRAIRRVHPRFRTPANAILIQAAWSLAQIVVVFTFVSNPKQAFDRLTDFVILGGTAFYGLTVAAVYVLRFRIPNQPRPYRTWGYPFTPLVYLVSVAAVVISITLNNPLQLATALGLLLVGVAVYGCVRRATGAEPV